MPDHTAFVLPGGSLGRSLREPHSDSLQTILELAEGAKPITQMGKIEARR